MSTPHLWEPPDEPANWLATACSGEPVECIHKLRETSASPPPTTAGRAAPGRYPGTRYAQIVKLRPGLEAEYTKMHEQVWPGVLDVIRSCGIQDYSICYDPDTRILFASFKYVGHDYERDMARMRANEEVQKWWQLTDQMQESFVPGAKGSVDGQPAWWKPIKEVFYLA